MTTAEMTLTSAVRTAIQPEPLGVSIAHAAQMLNVHPNTVRNQIKSQRLKSYRVGSRVLVSLESLRQLVK